MCKERKNYEREKTMAAIIEVKNVSKTFTSKDGNVEALTDINLSVEKGCIYGIIGMSGAGKSTLVRCFNFLEKPTLGEVIVDGRNLESLSDKELRQERSEIGMIFQGFNLLMQKNVLKNVMFPLEINGISKDKAKKRAKELLGVVGLGDKENAYPAQLSGGQKQRVAIARALANNPKILLCDEATSALDPQTTHQILDLLKEINKDLGITIVIITHQMSVVREICHNVAIIEKGRLVENGSVEEIFAHPKSKAAKQLVIEGKDPDEWNDQSDSSLVKIIDSTRKIRIVFSTNDAKEPVIANMILKFNTAVNILKADTKDVGGVAKGQMILGLPDGADIQDKIIEYLKVAGLEVEEVTDHV